MRWERERAKGEGGILGKNMCWLDGQMRVYDVFCAECWSGAMRSAMSVLLETNASVIFLLPMPAAAISSVTKSSSEEGTILVVKTHKMGFETNDGVVHRHGVFWVDVRRSAMWKILMFCDIPLRVGSILRQNGPSIEDFDDVFGVPFSVRHFLTQNKHPIPETQEKMGAVVKKKNQEQLRILYRSTTKAGFVKRNILNFLDSVGGASYELSFAHRVIMVSDDARALTTRGSCKNGLSKHMHKLSGVAMCKRTCGGTKGVAKLQLIDPTCVHKNVLLVEKR